MEGQLEPPRQPTHGGMGTVADSAIVYAEGIMGVCCVLSSFYRCVPPATSLVLPWFPGSNFAKSVGNYQYWLL